MSKRRIMLDTRKVTAVDDSITHRFWPARKHPEPVLLGDRPWERFGPLLFGTVMVDQERYRMWYNPYPVVPPPGNSYYVGYAESLDGLHWEKPDLDIEPYGDFQRTNLVNLIRHNPSVVLDADDPDPERRYKATGYVGTEQIMKERNAAYPGNGYYLAHSPDGLYWTENPATGPMGTVHDVGNFIADEPRGRYFGTVKTQVRYDLVDRRSVAVTASEDFQRWTEPRTVLVADALDDRIAREKGYHHAEFYGMALDPYDDFIVGLLWIYWVPLPFLPGRRTGWWGVIDCHLVFSYDDGNHWHRTPDRQPFIPMGEKGEFDGGHLYTCNRPVVVNDEVWLYYTGAKRDHSYFDPIKARHTMDYRTDVDWQDPRMGNEYAISIAKIKRDRYASLSTGNQGSFVVDHGVIDGSRLLVNARAPLGSVRAEALEGDGNPIEGFGVEDCLGFSGDAVSGEIKWRDKSLAELPPDCEINLRFVLDDADFFAYELAGTLGVK